MSTREAPARLGTALHRPTRGGPRVVGLLGFALDEAQARLNREVAPRHPQLRPAHLQLFRYSTIEGRRVTELAALARMTKQSMHELVGHLQDCGYLRREPDPADVRARLIRLTERGRQLEADVVAAASGLDDHWRARLGERRFQTLVAALREIATDDG